MSDSTLSFIQISDTHIGPQQDYTFRSYAPYTQTKKLLEHLAIFPEQASFIIHTGDVCGDKDAHADEPSYKLAQQLFQDVEIPLYTLPGNHDETPLLKKYFPPVDHDWLDETEDRMSYTFVKQGHRFVVLDAAVRSKRAGVLPARQLSALKELLQSSLEPITIFLHYPPLPLQCRWIDETMLLTNGADLHELLRSHASSLRGVFFGHVHQPIQLFTDGILYCCAAASMFQFSSFYESPDGGIDTQSPQGFNFVSMTESGIRINPRCVPQA